MPHPSHTDRLTGSSGRAVAPSCDHLAAQADHVVGALFGASKDSVLDLLHDRPQVLGRDLGIVQAGDVAGGFVIQCRLDAVGADSRALCYRCPCAPQITRADLQAGLGSDCIELALNLCCADGVSLCQLSRRDVALGRLPLGGVCQLLCRLLAPLGLMLPQFVVRIDPFPELRQDLGGATADAGLSLQCGDG
jgi:hypothetical protein